MSFSYHNKNLLRIVKEIRECKDCETKNLNNTTIGGTPFVFVGKNPHILVVSEIPYSKAWEKNEGKDWAEGKSFLPDNQNIGISNRLCSWLKIDRYIFKEKVFWIQRANCCVEKGKQFVFQHCSEKFLRRVIESLKPKLIITLGKPAAQYFFQFNKLKNLFKQEIEEGILTCNVWGTKYDCLVLPHPSGAARKSQKILNEKGMIDLLLEAKKYFI